MEIILQSGSFPTPEVVLQIILQSGSYLTPGRAARSSPTWR